MKKAALGILIVVAIIIVGGGWFTGSMAHERVGALAEHITKQSNGMLHVVERKSNRSLFSSVEDVTFSFENPFMKALVGSMGDKGPPMQFTIHNVILHGPVPGFRTVGIARIESSIVMDERTSKMLISTIGTDKPLELFVTFGFTGSTRIDVNSPPLKVDLPSGQGTITWKGMQSNVNYSRNFGEFTSKVTVPGLLVDGVDGETVAFTNLSVDSKFETAFEELFVGDGAIKLDSFDFSGKGGTTPPVRMKNLGYGLKLSQDKEYINMRFNMGADNFESPPQAFKDMHFDFAMNHLHGPTTAGLYKYFQELSAKQMQSAPPVPDAGSADAPSPVGPDFAKLQTDVGTLFMHSPEFVIEHLGFATSDGDLKISARFKLEGVTEADVKGGDPMQLLQKLIVTADVGVAKGLVENWPVESTKSFLSQVKELEAKGLITSKGDRLESHIEFKDGKMTANGKPM
jgi:uncharacterized protein YdgA (DUF945 family)